MEHLGKKYSDFNIVGNDYVDLYSLCVGDYFMEDTYPEVYIVTAIKDGIVTSHDLTSNDPGVDWFYSMSAYAPCLVKLEPKPSTPE
jgi:hypothetical protein